MQIKKTYEEVNPELLYGEMKDFILKQGMSIGDAKIETYTLPGDTPTFISRGTLIFKVEGKSGKECLRAHAVGPAKTETKVMLDIDEKLFPQEKVSAL